MGLMAEIFPWWGGQTIGTRLSTWRYGKKVGEDADGNTFYQSKNGKKRWVIYSGEAEASKIAPDWHGWLHHTFKEPPTEAPLPRKDWEKPHLPNLTGTGAEYRPAGSLMQTKPSDRKDYEAWVPE